MPINRIRTDNSKFLYFITPTIRNWYYMFDRHNRWRIIADSLIYCQHNKGLEIYAYVFMLNHLHLIIRSDDAIGFMRDFKKYTSKRLLENIKQYEPSILELFGSSDRGYRFWKEDNQPKIIETNNFARQKVEYIHNNPVLKGYVNRAQDWKWSSANPYSEIKILDLGLI